MKTEGGTDAADPRAAAPAPARIWIVAAALFVLLWWALASSLPDWKLPDEVSSYDQRFGPLRPRMPEGGTVGFLTNIPAGDGGLLWREHYLAQYALAPAIVVRSSRRTFVVASVYANLPPLPADSLAGLDPVADLGNGVTLYRRTSR